MDLPISVGPAYGSINGFTYQNRTQHTEESRFCLFTGPSRISFTILVCKCNEPTIYLLPSFVEFRPPIHVQHYTRIIYPYIQCAVPTLAYSSFSHTIYLVFYRSHFHVTNGFYLRNRINHRPSSIKRIPFKAFFSTPSNVRPTPHPL